VNEPLFGDETPSACRSGPRARASRDLGSITAAGGWCAPSSVIYDIAQNLAANPIDYNEVAELRGYRLPPAGIQYPGYVYPPPETLL
jgi:hypothetical protein